MSHSTTAGPGRGPHHDFQVRSRFSVGSGSIAENVAAAEAAGLGALALVDRVAEDTEWLPEFTAGVRSAQQRTHLPVLCGVEARLVGLDGGLAAPLALDGVDFVAVAADELPRPGGTCPPVVARAQIDSGRWKVADVVTDLAEATARAASRTTRPTLIAQLFSILPSMGLDQDDVPLSVVRDMATELRRAGAVVELSERWRTPGPRVVGELLAAGVPVVASTEARTPGHIGRYRWITRTFRPEHLPDSSPAMSLLRAPAHTFA